MWDIVSKKVRKSLFRQLYPSFLGILLVAISAIVFLLAMAFKEFYLELVKNNLDDRLNLLMPIVVQKINKNENLNLYFKGIKGKTHYHLFSLEGELLANNVGDMGVNSGFLNRKEISEAIKSNYGYSKRYRYRYKSDFIYVAHLIPKKGILRASVPVDYFYSSVFNMYGEVIVVGLLMFIAISFVSFRFISRVTQPIERLKQVALDISKGEFYSKVYFSTKVSEEVYQLGLAMNEISDQIRFRVKEAFRSREEQEAILSSMKEAVVSLNMKEELLYCNESAKQLFDIQSKAIQLIDVTREPRLLDYVRRGIEKEKFDEIEVQVNDKFIEMNIAPIRGRKQKLKAVVWVLRDLSEIKKLEKYRKEFVANVSHELRTPLTSIQGFAETLLNPKLMDEEQKNKFTKVIHDQSQRLGQLIQDLLTLSRIEHMESDHFEFEEKTLDSMVNSVIEVCQVKADVRNIKLKKRGDLKVNLIVHRSLFEQALINLVDNAIKYTPDGGDVQIDVLKKNNKILMSVIDRGPGISEKHLARLFERFYRVDKARSRSVGGTGLGLSIVKHVCQLHKGEVYVESQINKGSQFTIEIPYRADLVTRDVANEKLT